MLVSVPTTVRTATKATPFSLVYGCEAVLPLKIQIPSLRIAIASSMTDEKGELSLQYEDQWRLLMKVRVSSSPNGKGHS